MDLRTEKAGVNGPLAVGGREVYNPDYFFASRYEKRKLV